MNNVRFNRLVVALIAVLCGMVIGLWVPADNNTPAQMAAETARFDTSIIEENWCSGLDEGQVRMVSATYKWSDAAQTVVKDEQGNAWAILEEVNENDFLLLWIADNGTETISDDVIIKVWREVR